MYSSRLPIRLNRQKHLMKMQKSYRRYFRIRHSNRLSCLLYHPDQSHQHELGIAY
jgi:hypothetical protein